MLVTGVLSGTGTVEAECSRVPLRDIKRGAHFLFEATVTQEARLSGGRVIADLDVGRVWKGDVRRRSRLFYDIESLDTQQFHPGKRYVIYAPWFAVLDFTDPRRVPADVPTGGCGWGRPYEEAQAELPDLGAGKRAR